jgi:hypothetical protein
MSNKHIHMATGNNFCRQNKAGWDDKDCRDGVIWAEIGSNKTMQLSGGKSYNTERKAKSQDFLQLWHLDCDGVIAVDETFATQWKASKGLWVWFCMLFTHGWSSGLECVQLSKGNEGSSQDCAHLLSKQGSGSSCHYIERSWPQLSQQWGVMAQLCGRRQPIGAAMQGQLYLAQGSPGSPVGFPSPDGSFPLGTQSCRQDFPLPAASPVLCLRPPGLRVQWIGSGTLGKQRLCGYTLGLPEGYDWTADAARCWDA